MKPMKKILAALCAFALAAGLLAGCTTGGASQAGSQAGGTSANATAVASTKVKDEDLDAGWDEASATKITLNGPSATVNGSGAVAEGGTVTISTAGTYVVSGTLDDGQIVIQAPTEALVRLVLNGAAIHGSTTAPIVCQQADKLVVILADGTTNTLSDGDTYVFPNETTDEPSATLFSKADLTINGTGTLVVNAAYNNGIGTKDDLIIVSGTITVTATGHAIRGRDSVTVLDGTLNLTSGNDGIQANNDTAEDKGWIELYGGVYNIESGHDGIQAETTLSVFGGEYSITAGGGSENAEERVEEQFPGGGWGGGGNFTPPEGFEPPEGMEIPEDFEMPEGFEPPEGFTMPEDGTPPQGMQGTPPGASAPDSQADGAAPDDADNTAGTDGTGDAATDATTEDSDTTATSTSYKGLKAAGALAVSGGSFNINSADDAVHSNTSITVSGGSFTIATGDDAMHADDTLTIEGSPTINITESYEGLEAADVIIKGGDITIVASDDGINAAGGRDATTTGGGFGRDSFVPGDYLIRIEGGNIRVTAGADGLDSNGNIEIAGGSLLINMTNYQAIGGDGALDRDGTMVITGGVVLCAAGNGIVTIGQGGGESESTQAALEVYYTAVQAAGTAVELKDAAGNTVASFTPEFDFQCVVFSAPGLAEGESYTLVTGGSETVTVELTSAVTSVKDTGEAVTGGMGPGGNRGGGMGGRPGQQQPASSESAA